VVLLGALLGSGPGFWMAFALGTGFGLGLGIGLGFCAGLCFAVGLGLSAGLGLGMGFGRVGLDGRGAGLGLDPGDGLRAGLAPGLLPGEGLGVGLRGGFDLRSTRQASSTRFQHKPIPHAHALTQPSCSALQALVQRCSPRPSRCISAIIRLAAGLRRRGRRRRWAEVSPVRGEVPQP
jgi:hypothetical protein